MKTLQKSILRTWKGVDKMRVSDNITNEMAKKAGLPINMRGAGESTKNTLLEALDNKKIEDDYFTDSAVDTKKMKELTKTADNLIDIAETFDTDVKNNKLFEEAKNNNDMSNVIEKTKSFASSYNDLLKSLSSNNDGLFFLSLKMHILTIRMSLPIWESHLIRMDICRLMKKSSREQTWIRFKATWGICLIRPTF